MPQLSSGCRNYSNGSAKSRTRQDQTLSAVRLDSNVARPVVRIRPPRQTETGIYRKMRGDKFVIEEKRTGNIDTLAFYGCSTTAALGNLAGP